MTTRNLQKKLDLMLVDAKSRVVKRANSCKGKPAREILDLVETMVNPADEDLVERVVAFVDEQHAARQIEIGKDGPLLDDTGQPVYHPHFFIEWLRCLHWGDLLLPDQLPRIFWLSFCSRHGSVHRRCERCRAGWGNSNEARLTSVCPICGGAIWNRALWGTRWLPIGKMP
jgi:hypothetical protein